MKKLHFLARLLIELYFFNKRHAWRNRCFWRHHVVRLFTNTLSFSIKDWKRWKTNYLMKFYYLFNKSPKISYNCYISLEKIKQLVWTDQNPMYLRQTWNFTKGNLSFIVLNNTSNTNAQYFSPIQSRCCAAVKRNNVDHVFRTILTILLFLTL